MKSESPLDIEKALKGFKPNNNQYYESSNPKFPPIGSRVRRGPDWKWNQQDSFGPGTVIGHSDSSRCFSVYVY